MEFLGIPIIYILIAFSTVAFYSYKLAQLLLLVYVHWWMPPDKLEEFRKTLEILNKGKFWNGFKVGTRGKQL